MRDYAVFKPSFWTGKTGRQIRALGDDCIIVATYLFTAPSSNMIGLYYIPLPTLAHETGRTIEGATKALRSLSEVGFAHYEEEAETIWVPEMARFQIGESLQPKDNRCKSVERQALEMHKARHFPDFVRRYWKAFSLPGWPLDESPLKAPPEPLRSQDQDQDQDQGQDPPLAPVAPAGPDAPPRTPAAGEGASKSATSATPGLRALPGSNPPDRTYAMASRRAIGPPANSLARPPEPELSDHEREKLAIAVVEQGFQAMSGLAHAQINTPMGRQHLRAALDRGLTPEALVAGMRAVRSEPKRPGFDATTIGLDGMLKPPMVDKGQLLLKQAATGPPGQPGNEPRKRYPAGRVPMTALMENPDGK